MRARQGRDAHRQAVGSGAEQMDVVEGHVLVVEVSTLAEPHRDVQVPGSAGCGVRGAGCGVAVAVAVAVVS